MATKLISSYQSKTAARGTHGDVEGKTRIGVTFRQPNAPSRTLQGAEGKTGMTRQRYQWLQKDLAAKVTSYQASH